MWIGYKVSGSGLDPNRARPKISGSGRDVDPAESKSSGCSANFGGEIPLSSLWRVMFRITQHNHTRMDTWKTQKPFSIVPTVPQTEQQRKDLPGQYPAISYNHSYNCAYNMNIISYVISCALSIQCMLNFQWFPTKILQKQDSWLEYTNISNLDLAYHTLHSCHVYPRHVPIAVLLAFSTLVDWYL